MYFNFDDSRPDITPVGGAITWREGILLSIICHLLLIIAALLMPDLPLTGRTVSAEEQLLLQRQRERDAQRFVFVQPRVDLEALRPPPRADLSDKNRRAQAPERAKTPTNPLPFARGNSAERVEAERLARGPDPEDALRRLDESRRGVADAGSAGAASPNAFPFPQLPQAVPAPPPGTETGAAGSGLKLGDALRNPQRYSSGELFDNQSGDAGAFGPSIQFDSKGADFGPWIRRFVAQIKRNWFIPYAAMAMRGHVALTFYVHRDGTISELAVPAPADVEAFNRAAYNALVASNPTQPLPLEYPDDRCFFRVTFYYNETPPMQ